MSKLEKFLLNNIPDHHQHHHIPSSSSLPMFTILLSLIIALILLLYYMKYYHLNYWKRHGITYVKPSAFLGNLKDIVMYRKSIADIMYQAYFSEPTESILGFHFFHKPILIVRQPELIKNILIKDFNYFCNRFTTCDQKSDLLSSSNVLLARNPFWKKIRSRLSPLFSSSLRRKMFHLIKNIGIKLNKYLLDTIENANSNEIIIDIKDFTTRYTTDVIAACAFGVDSNSIENPNSEFREGGKSIVEFNLLRGFEFMAFFFIPDIVPILKLKFFSEKTNQFLRKHIYYIMEVREKNGIPGNDLIDKLIMLKNEDKDKEESENELLFKGDTLVAQAGIFLSGGYETVATNISFTLYELARQPLIQKRLREEIKEYLLKTNGNLTYDDIIKMQYLDMVFSESLRLYPSLPYLDRVCQLPIGDNQIKGYSLYPYSDYNIPHGMGVVIPVFAIHRDPQYFPNPTKFDPERFSPANKLNIKPYTYFPFGMGPRMCIASKFALLASKIGLIHLLQNHFVDRCEKTPNEIQFKPTSILLQSIDGLFLKIVKDKL